MEHKNIKKQAEKTPVKMLLWIPVYLLDVLLVIIVQCLFIHTIPGPVTEKTLLEQDFFRNCKILDYSIGHGDGWWAAGATFQILYQTEEGTQKVVRLDTNRAVERFGIIERTAQNVPEQSGPVTVKVPSLLGYIELTIENNKFVQHQFLFWTRNQSTATWELILWGFFLQGIEAFFLVFVKRRVSLKSKSEKGGKKA